MRFASPVSATELMQSLRKVNEGLLLLSSSLPFGSTIVRPPSLYSLARIDSDESTTDEIRRSSDQYCTPL